MKKSRGKRPVTASVISSTVIRFGVDRVIEQPDRVPSSLFSGAWGMVTNDAARRPVPSAGAIDRNAVTDAGNDADPLAHPDHLSRKALLDAGVPLKQLFAPEHGISAAGADGQAMQDDRDPVTGLPVCSLYGERMRPPAELLDPLDGLLFDIPDIGTRFYTYIWTLSHVMEACADADKPLVVLDRPNPIGGELMAAEGPILDTRNCAGFLGRAPIPVRHSLTIGEFARWLASFWKLDLDLVVVPVKGWKRAMYWPDTHLPFVPTSPAIPSFESALCYPGTALFEATNVSAGRGTLLPFQQIGAPWLRAAEVVAEIADAVALPGVRFAGNNFRPVEHPWKGEQCRGIRLVVTDRNAFRPVRTGLALLAVIRRLHPDLFSWKTYPTAANPSGEGHFERLIGRNDIRPDLQLAPEDFLQKLPERLETPSWVSETRDFLLYNNNHK